PAPAARPGGDRTAGDAAELLHPRHQVDALRLEVERRHTLYLSSAVKASTVGTVMVTVAAASYRPPLVREDDGRFVPLAAELGARFAPEAAVHDRENTFVAGNYEALRESGYTLLPIPTELGGLGASVRQICAAQAELARHCAATALAIAMHLH